jgi:hypothetical protein
MVADQTSDIEKSNAAFGFSTTHDFSSIVFLEEKDLQGFPGTTA